MQCANCNAHPASTYTYINSSNSHLDSAHRHAYTDSSDSNSTEPFTLATSAENIIGAWVVGNYYIRFDKDGAFRQAHTPDELKRNPYSISSYKFEGTKMIIAEMSVSGVPTCGKKIGSYEIQLLESGNIRIMPIKDECEPRARDIAGEYELVR